MTHFVLPYPAGISVRLLAKLTIVHAAAFGELPLRFRMTMLLPIVTDVEKLITHIAVVNFLMLVRDLVLMKVDEFRKCPVANLASEAFDDRCVRLDRFGVGELVFLQRGFPSEDLVADVAVDRFLVLVGETVPVEVVRADEATAADFAYVAFPFVEVLVVRGGCAFVFIGNIEEFHFDFRFWLDVRVQIRIGCVRFGVDSFFFNEN